MTLANLATCWAPNLLRSKEESYEKVLREASLVKTFVDSGKLTFQGQPSRHYADRTH